uniref:phosphotransferase n=1 Tax=Paractinoplanes polyasparticus TaxID=2856853 RepID=UPI001C847D24|nr:phosphotransferase [Actinoplanes polyasparticus]
MTRPRLSEAPAAVRDTVAELLGTAVLTERPAQGGFTPSIASVVAGRAGVRRFVKAAPVGAGLGEAVEAGVVLADVVGDIGPRLVGSASIGEWRVAVYEVIEGVTVERWEPSDIRPLLTLLGRLRERAEPCPVAGTSPYAEAFVPLLGTWQSLTAPSSPDRSGPCVLPTVDHVRDLALPVDVPLPLLAELESRWSSVLRPGRALHHGDLRRDNVIREPDGRLRIVDWTHLWTAPGWMDLVRLAPDVAACGHDPEALLRNSPWAGARDDHVNVALAGLAGRAWREGHLPDLPAVPGLRDMQRVQAFHLLRWLDFRQP